MSLFYVVDHVLIFMCIKKISQNRRQCQRSLKERTKVISRHVYSDVPHVKFVKAIYLVRSYATPI